MTIIFDVVYRAYLPVIVDSRTLAQANSRLSATASAAEVGPFSLAGWIAQLFSAIVVTTVDSATFLVSPPLLSWICHLEPELELVNGTPGYAGRS